MPSNTGTQPEIDLDRTVAPGTGSAGGLPGWAKAAVGFAVVAVAFAIAAMGLVIFGDSTEPDQADIDGTTEAVAEQPQAGEPTTGVSSDGAVDGAAPPAGVELFSLGSKSQVVGASATSDAVLIARESIGTEGQGCEGYGPRFELTTVRSDGSPLAKANVDSGVWTTGVPAPGNSLILSEGCEGIVDPSMVVEFNADGTLVVGARLRVDERSVSYWLPAWSADGSRVLVTALGVDNRPELLSFDRQGNLIDTAFVDGRVQGEFANGTRIYSTDSMVYVGDSSQAVVVQDEWNQQLVRMSPDNQLAAVYGGSILAVTDANGVVVSESFDPSGQFLAAAWAPDGRLAYTTTADALIHVVHPITGASYTLDPGVPGALWYGVEFTSGGSALAFSGYDGDGREVAFGARFASLPTRPVVAAAPVGSSPAAAETTSYGIEPLRLRGIGAIDFGMTVEQAERATGGVIVPVGSSANASSCVIAQLAGDASGPTFMVIVDGGAFGTGRIVRADLPPAGATRSGVQIGASKAEVLATYGERIVVSPHKYTFADGGEYLTFVPADAIDADYRLVMETADDRVAAIRSGLVPFVEWVEGCA